MVRHLRRAAIAVGAAAASTLFLAMPAHAANPNGATHFTMPVAGASFTCGPVDLTGTGGTINFTFRQSPDGNHVTGTGAVIGGVLEGSDGNTYYVSGAFWFGGNATHNGSSFESTDTDHLVIRNPSGGILGMVSTVEHFSPTGGFSFDFGSCTDNNG